MYLQRNLACRALLALVTALLPARTACEPTLCDATAAACYTYAGSGSSLPFASAYEFAANQTVNGTQGSLPTVITAHTYLLLHSFLRLAASPSWWLGAGLSPDGVSWLAPPVRGSLLSTHSNATLCADNEASLNGSFCAWSDGAAPLASLGLPDALPTPLNVTHAVFSAGARWMLTNTSTGAGAVLVQSTGWSSGADLVAALRGRRYLACISSLGSCYEVVPTLVRAAGPGRAR